MDGYRHQEVTDETLEKDIEAALGVDPSPGFLPRIRARIANERIQEGWFWSASWRWARVAAVVTAVAVIAVWTLRDPSRAPRQPHVVDTPPVESTPPPVDSALPAPALVASSAESSKPVSAPVARAERSTRHPAVVARPEVLVSLDEAAALRQLIGAIAARQVEAMDIPRLAAESAPLPMIEEIVLEPIETAPPRRARK
jgi:hypothetical protein